MKLSVWTVASGLEIRIGEVAKPISIRVNATLKVGVPDCQMVG